jgi:hypothetical protein
MAPLTALIGHPATAAIVYDICLSVRLSKRSNIAFIWFHVICLASLAQREVASTRKNLYLNLQIKNNYKECYILRYKAGQSPRSLPCFGGMYCIHLQGKLLHKQAAVRVGSDRSSHSGDLDRHYLLGCDAL